MGHIREDVLVDLDDYPDCASHALSPISPPGPPFGARLLHCVTVARADRCAATAWPGCVVAGAQTPLLILANKVRLLTLLPPYATPPTKPSARLLPPGEAPP